MTLMRAVSTTRLTVAREFTGDSSRRSLWQTKAGGSSMGHVRTTLPESAPMARRDHDEEDDYGGDDFPPSPLRKSGSGGLILGGALLVLLLSVGVVVIFGFWAVAVPQQEAMRAEMEANRMKKAGGPDAAKPMRKLLTRREFEALVMNKPREKIIASVGEPDEIWMELRIIEKNATSTENAFWHYKVRVLDEATGQAYPTARVHMNYEGSFRVDYQ